jgi:hypothetical protein
MNILCYGDSNTWGTPPRRDFGDVPRYGDDVRWGSVLRAGRSRSRARSPGDRPGHPARVAGRPYTL